MFYCWVFCDLRFECFKNIKKYFKVKIEGFAVFHTVLNKVLKMSDNEERASLLQQGVNYVVERLQIYFEKICCNRLTCFSL